MKNNFFRCWHTLALTLGLAATPTALLAQNNAPTLQEQLAAQYPMANATNGCNVGNPETALVIQAKGGGIRVLPVNSTVTIAKCSNHYANGTLHSANSACNGEALSKAGSVASKIPKIGGIFGRGQPKVDEQVGNQQMDVVKTGGTVYPVKLEVNESKGEVKFGIITCLQSGDNHQAPYKGELIFQFSKDTLKPENITKVEDVVAEVFSQNQHGQDGQAQPQDNGGQDQGLSASGRNQDPTPQQNNQASACNPETEQTVDQVVTACGNPVSQAKGSGTKQIYFYNQPKLKITFMNGKVSDIE